MSGNIFLNGRFIPSVAESLLGQCGVLRKCILCGGGRRGAAPGGRGAVEPEVGRGLGPAGPRARDRTQRPSTIPPQETTR